MRANYTLDSPVPGREQFTFRQISRRAAEKILKEEASFMAICRRSVKSDGVKIAVKIMKDENEKAQTRLNAVQYLTNYGYGTPPKMRGNGVTTLEDTEPEDRTLTIRIEGGLPKE